MSVVSCALYTSLNGTQSYISDCMTRISLNTLYVDVKAEDLPLSTLRSQEGENWRKVMDLERALCFGAAKMNCTVYLGNVMVQCKCHTSSTC